MAGIRIPELTPLSGAASASNDELVIYDVSLNVTNRISRSQLAIGLANDLPYPAILADITALRAITWSAGRPTLVQVINNWATGDGGGEFRWDGASTATDNGGSIIKETATTIGRWLRQDMGQTRKISWFGAIIPMVDSSTAISAAIMSLPAAGGVVEFDVPEITIATPILLNTSDIHLRTDSRWTTNIINTSTNTPHIRVNVGTGVQKSNISIEGFVFTCANTQTSGAGHAVHFEDVTYGRIKELRFFGDTKMWGCWMAESCLEFEADDIEAENTLDCMVDVFGNSPSSVGVPGGRAQGIYFKGRHYYYGAYKGRTLAVNDVEAAVRIGFNTEFVSQSGALLIGDIPANCLGLNLIGNPARKTIFGRFAGLEIEVTAEGAKGIRAANCQELDFSEGRAGGKGIVGIDILASCDLVTFQETWETYIDGVAAAPALKIASPLFVYVGKVVGYTAGKTGLLLDRGTMSNAWRVSGTLYNLSIGVDHLNATIANQGKVDCVFDDTVLRQQRGSTEILGGARSTTVANMTSGTAILTSSDAPFTARDVGKLIGVFNGAGSGNTLVTTILSFQSATQVTLATNASAAVVNQRAAWGWDETFAIQAQANTNSIDFPLDCETVITAPIALQSFGNSNGMTEAATASARGGQATVYALASMVAMFASKRWFTVDPDKAFPASPWQFINIVRDAMYLADNCRVIKEYAPVDHMCHDYHYRVGGVYFTRQNQDATDGSGTVFLSGGKFIHPRAASKMGIAFRTEGYVAAPFDGPTDGELIAADYNGLGTADKAAVFACNTGWIRDSVRTYGFVNAGIEDKYVSARCNPMTNCNLEALEGTTAPVYLVGTVAPSYPFPCVMLGGVCYGPIRVDFTNNASFETVVFNNVNMAGNMTDSVDSVIFHNRNNANKMIIVEGGVSQRNDIVRLSPGNTLGVFVARNFTASTNNNVTTSAMWQTQSSGGFEPRFVNYNGGTTILTSFNYTGSVNAPATFKAMSVRGTFASPTDNAIFDQHGEFHTAGRGNGVQRYGGGFVTYAMETPTAGAGGTTLRFKSVPRGSTTPIETLDLDPDLGMAWKGLPAFVNPAGYLAMATFTVAGVPSAATNPRAWIYVSDEVGGATPAFSDGTNWRRVSDRAIIS